MWGHTRNKLFSGNFLAQGFFFSFFAAVPRVSLASNSSNISMIITQETNEGWEQAAILDGKQIIISKLQTLQTLQTSDSFKHYWQKARKKQLAGS